MHKAEENLERKFVSKVDNNRFALKQSGKSEIPLYSACIFHIFFGKNEIFEQWNTTL